MMINTAEQQQSLCVDRLVDRRLPIDTPHSSHDARSISARVAYLLSADHDSLPQADAVVSDLHHELPRALQKAFSDRDSAALLDVQKALFAIYELTFVDPLSPVATHEHSEWVTSVRRAIEKHWLDCEVPKIEWELPAESDLTDERRLTEWFFDQARRVTATDKLIVDFLAHHATKEQFRSFILIDTHLNYRFYDAIALAQLHFSECVKGELSHHFWDECGEGDVERSHTRQFTRMLEKLELPQLRIPPWNDWRPYAGYNLYLCFGLNRRHYFKSLGSLAMPELFDPDRDRAVVAGLERLDINAREDCAFYYSHIEGDEEHGPSWMQGVVSPIVRQRPESGREFALGGAMRMEYMRHFNEYLAATFNLVESPVMI